MLQGSLDEQKSLREYVEAEFAIMRSRDRAAASKASAPA
jgi:hypothetical protein